MRREVRSNLDQEELSDNPRDNLNIILYPRKLSTTTRLAHRRQNWSHGNMINNKACRYSELWPCFIYDSRKYFSLRFPNACNPRANNLSVQARLSYSQLTASHGWMVAFNKLSLLNLEIFLRVWTLKYFCYSELWNILLVTRFHCLEGVWNIGVQCSPEPCRLHNARLCVVIGF